VPKPFEVSNPDALAKAIKRLESAASESTLRKAAATGATVIKDEIAIRTPVDTGDLLSGLTVAYAPEDSVTGHLATYVVTFVGTAPDRANGKPGMRRRDIAGWVENGHANRISAIEHGTSRTAARPFIRPAFDAAKGQAVAASQAVILNALNKEDT
jgi:HK97 gp10 family phage protein